MHMRSQSDGEGVGFLLCNSERLNKGDKDGLRISMYGKKERREEEEEEQKSGQAKNKTTRECNEQQIGFGIPGSKVVTKGVSANTVRIRMSVAKKKMDGWGWIYCT